MIAGNFKVSSNLDYNGRLLCINVLTLDGKLLVLLACEQAFGIFSPKRTESLFTGYGSLYVRILL